MKVWKIKTMRHGETLTVAKTFPAAVAAFEKWNRGYLRRTRQQPTMRDDITSCECIGPIANA